MKINSLNNNYQNFKSNNTQETPKREFIDKFSDAIRNKRDVEDCVAVPRGIFKAYLFIMGGFGLLGIAGALPDKFKKTKSALIIAGNVLNFISAIYFAKPFAVKGVSPTINRDEFNKVNKKED